MVIHHKMTRLILISLLILSFTVPSFAIDTDHNGAEDLGDDEASIQADPSSSKSFDCHQFSNLLLNDQAALQAVKIALI